MTAEMETFLKAEEAATELLRNLEQLRQETEGYSEARRAIDEVTGQLSKLIEALGRASDQTLTVMTALKEIGTPEILASIEALRTVNRQTVASVEALHSETAGAMRSLTERTTSGLSGLTGSVTDASAKSVDASRALATRMKDHHSSMEQDTQDKFDRLIAAVEASQAATRGESTKTRWIVVVGVLLVLLGTWAIPTFLVSS